jgi:methyl-accepting chemotaxis protein
MKLNLLQKIWEGVFRPAIWVTNRLSYGQKLTLIGVVLLAPLGILLRLQYQAATKNLEYNQNEAIGVAYIDAAKDMLLALQKRRLLVAARQDVTAATKEADEAMARVEDLDIEHGALLETTESWEAIKAAWGSLRGSSFRRPADADAPHAAVTSLLVGLIENESCTNSNLLLDQELDSYWLMGGWCSKIPAIGEAISGTAATALRLIDQDNHGENADLGAELRQLSRRTDDLLNLNMRVAFFESRNPKYGMSPTLQSNLTDPSQKLGSAVSRYTEALEGKFGEGSSMPSEKLVVQSASEALQALTALYQKVGPELDWLLQKRITRYGGDRAQGLIFGLLGIGLTLYAFIGFYLAVKKSASSLAHATGKMIEGTQEVFQLEARDELGRVVDDFNRINRALVEARTLRQRVEQDNAELQENIMDLLQVVSQASEGDLSVRAKVSAGALGNVADAFNHLLESQRVLIGEILEQLRLTNDTVVAITRTSKDMATGATQQTHEILGAVSSVQAICAEIERVSSNARTAAEAAKRTQESALEGARGVQSIVNGMASLRASVQAGAKKMKSLGDRSMEITGIVATINRISEQTNMLALNAAIEAARAGEHGRGFSIVAESVRRLAERTATATREIDKLVKSIHTETMETAKAIEDQTHIVEQESALVGKAGESLAKISEVSTESAGLVAEISDVAQKQVGGATAVVTTMGQISSIARKTQTEAQGAAVTVEQLSTLSRQLNASISRFRLASGG